MPDGLSLAGRIQPKAGAVALRLEVPPEPQITLLREASGGDTVADVVEHTEAGEIFARKQLGKPKYEDFSVSVGSVMSPQLFDWIAESWRESPPHRDGAILQCDYKFSVKVERPFQGALIAETAFPALDAASKQPGFMELRFAAAAVLPDEKPLTPLAVPLGKPSVQKLWMTSLFKLQLSGLDCSHVMRIEPFSILRKIDTVTDAGGGVGLIAGSVEFPNFRVSISTAHAQSWVDWHEDFVVKGNNTAPFEKSGSISLLNVALDELTRLELNGVGIFRLVTEKPDRVESIPRVIADLYCEQMSLLPGGGP
jgi:hypothetical protein